MGSNQSMAMQEANQDIPRENNMSDMTLEERLGFGSKERTRGSLVRTDNESKKCDKPGGPKETTKCYIEEHVKINYELTLGEGSFAVVHPAKNWQTGKLYAVKIIYKNKLSSEELKLISREAVITSSLDHPNIIKSYFSVEDDETIKIFMDYYPGGDMQDYVDGRIPSECIAYYTFNQIFKAVEYLHSVGVVHRDIKLENVLFDNEQNMHVALIDFGFSSRWKRGDHLFEEYSGSPPYASPELMEGVPHDGTAPDIWALGVTLYILLTGSYPFYNRTFRELQEAVTNVRYDLSLVKDEEARDLIKSILIYDFKKRPTVRQIKEHRWMKKWEKYIMEHGHCDEQKGKMMSTYQPNNSRSSVIKSPTILTASFPGTFPGEFSLPTAREYAEIVLGVKMGGEEFLEEIEREFEPSKNSSPKRGSTTNSRLERSAKSLANGLEDKDDMSKYSKNSQGVWKKSGPLDVKNTNRDYKYSENVDEVGKRSLTLNSDNSLRYSQSTQKVNKDPSLSPLTNWNAVGRTWGTNNSSVFIEKESRGGNGSMSSGQGSMSSGQGTMSSGQGSMSSGQGTMSSGQGSMSSGQGSMSSGQGTMSSRQGSMSSGQGTMSSGQGSMSSGQGTMSSGQGSMSSGQGTMSSGQGTMSSRQGSMSSGQGTMSSRQGSMSSGQGTMSSRQGSMSSNYANPLSSKTKSMAPFSPLKSTIDTPMVGKNLGTFDRNEIMYQDSRY
jgi:serine/threonine protein kinase